MQRQAMLPMTVLALTAMGSVTASAQEADTSDTLEWVPMPRVELSTGLEPGFVDVLGRTVLHEGRFVARPFCGSDPRAVTVGELEAWANEIRAAESNEDKYLFDSTSGRGGTGFNLVFNLDGSIPAEALAAIATAEQYIESQFGDPITVVLSMSFANLGSGVLGQAGSNSLFVDYNTVARPSLVAGMDANDTIQDFLPTGNTVPVRYNSVSTTITNETRVSFNRATYEATIGSIGGTDAFITFSTAINWDYDPSNGVFGTDFQSVMIHEVGHSLGFVSNADGFSTDIDALDLFRFPRSDSVNGVNGDWNPDTNAEFQTKARMVDSDDPNTGNDNSEVDANSDLIFAEYRMSDGFPSQASHFNEGFNGIMDPTLGSGQTFFPNFYRTADLNMFDAIGYDVPPAAPGSFSLVTPANGASGVGLTDPISWETAVSANEYRLRVDDNSNFSSPVIDLIINGAFTSYSPDPGELQPLTTYFWTVDAFNPLGSTTITPSSASFTTDISPVGAFALLSPPNFASTSTTPTLDWGDSANAESYLVEVSTSTLFFTNAIEVTVPAPTTEYVVMPGELAADTTYFWRVTASNASSSLGSIPATTRFTTDAVPVNTCPADFNGDGVVNLGDFGLFGAAFGSSVGDANYDPLADFNDDGAVNLGDFGVFGGEFGRTDCLD